VTLRYYTPRKQILLNGWICLHGVLD